MQLFGLSEQPAYIIDILGKLNARSVESDFALFFSRGLL
ncbi:hypothetical protein IX308_000151 [Porphyromonas levii]|nr:hypothetical protein [Porphyromonas levii]MBR8783993.1 hypothetical protein [Porphyromonas levii]